MISLVELTKDAASLNRMFKVQVILVTDRKHNKTETINELRGVEGVVYVKVRQNQNIIDRGDENSEYTLLEIKYMATKNTPVSAIKMVKQKATKGDSEQKRILGLRSFYIIEKSIVEV
jgi:hypothetical protein